MGAHEGCLGPRRGEQSDECRLLGCVGTHSPRAQEPSAARLGSWLCPGLEPQAGSSPCWDPGEMLALAVLQQRNWSSLPLSWRRSCSQLSREPARRVGPPRAASPAPNQQPSCEDTPACSSSAGQECNHPLSHLPCCLFVHPSIYPFHSLTPPSAPSFIYHPHQ